jgi:hypothetical protein
MCFKWSLNHRKGSIELPRRRQGEVVTTVGVLRKWRSRLGERWMKLLGELTEWKGWRWIVARSGAAARQVQYSL